MFEEVRVPAEQREVLSVGLAAEGPVVGVVDIVMGGGAGAARGSAAQVPDLNGFAEPGRDLVAVAADGENDPGFGVHEQAGACQ
jgi:hypothetical protein